MMNLLLQTDPGSIPRWAQTAILCITGLAAIVVAATLILLPAIKKLLLAWLEIKPLVEKVTEKCQEIETIGKATSQLIDANKQIEGTPNVEQHIEAAVKSIAGNSDCTPTNH